MNTQTISRLVRACGITRVPRFAALFLFVSTLHGYVFKENYIISGSIGGAPPEIHTLFVSSSEDGTNPASVSLRLGDAGLVYVAEWTPMDDGADLYFASYGDTFSNNTIAADGFTIFNTAGTSGQEYPLGTGLFYMGVNAGLNRDVFGWALFNYTGNSLELVDSLMVFGAEGILIGKAMAVVPEMDNIGLWFGFASILYILRSRRLNNRN